MPKNQSIKNQDAGLLEIFFSGLQEVLGASDMEKLLVGSKARNKYQIDDILQEIEKVYGQRSGRGIAVLIGRTSFSTILQTMGQKIGLTDLECRLMPSIKRIMISLERLAKAFTSQWQLPVEIIEFDTYWEWRSYKKTSYFTFGVLQECLAWVSGDKLFLVEEIGSSSNCNDMTVFHISKTPMG